MIKKNLLLGILGVAAVQVGAGAAGDVAGACGLDEIADSLHQAGVAHAAFIRRQVIKIVTNANGTTSNRVIVVVGDDSVTNEVDRVEVSLEPVGNAPLPSAAVLRLQAPKVKTNGNKRFVNADLEFASDPAGQSYTLTSTMLDAKGKQVGAASVETVQVAGKAEIEPSVTIRQIDPTNFELQVIVYEKQDGPTNSVDVIFVDYTGPAPIPTEVTLTNPRQKGGRKIFTISTITFEDPKAAGGELYNVIIDRKDARNKSLGYSEEGVYVEGLETV